MVELTLLSLHFLNLRVYISYIFKGNESLDELEKYAVEMFSEIPNKNLSKVDFPTDPYKRDIPANVLYVVPVQDLRQLSISWVIPDSRDSYQSNPSNYISHLGNGIFSNKPKHFIWNNFFLAFFPTIIY